MPFKPPERSFCPKCSQAVYAAEERIGAGKKWHKQCFKCAWEYGKRCVLCWLKRTCTSSSEESDQLSERTCGHDRNFYDGVWTRPSWSPVFTIGHSPAGMCNKLLDSTTVAEHEGLVFCKSCHGKKFGPKGYGFGGGAGALSMETGEQFGNKQSEMSNRPKEAVIGAKSGPGPHCPRCLRTVYDAERAIGLNDYWHKSCCNCKECHKSLDASTLNRHDEEIFCKGCYAKHYGPHWYGVGTLAK